MGEHRINLAGNECCCREEPRSGGGYAVGCEVEGASPDDRREEDHALARNRSAIGYTFMMQAGI